MKNFAKTFLKTVGDHAVSVAAHHAKMSKAHAAMGDGLEKGSPEDVFHKSASHEHADQSANWTALAESCGELAGKAATADFAKMFMDNGDALIPSAVSAIAPTAPVGRLVLRHGQREITSADVDPQFRKMLAVNDEEEE